MRPWNGESSARSRWSVPRSASNASRPLRPAPLTAWYDARSTDAEAGEIADRRQGDHRGGRRAVRICDQVAAALTGGVGIGLGHDERHIIGQAERARVVDHQGDRCAGPGHDLAALSGVDGQEQHVELAGVVVGQDVDGNRCAAVRERVSFLVPKGAQALGREAGIGEDRAEDPAHHASGAGNAHRRPSIHAGTIHARGGMSLAAC